jgi:hypothetical protein
MFTLNKIISILPATYFHVFEDVLFKGHKQIVNLQLRDTILI